MLQNLLSLLFLTSICAGDTKTWQWSNSYSEPSHWLDGKLPCPGQEVNLPAEIISMPATTVMGPTINIAKGGMLVLPSTSSIQLVDHDHLPPPSSGCLVVATPATYKSPPSGEWYDPANWRKPGPSPRPHTHQVPCASDTAVFPPGMTYKTAVTEEDVSIAELSISGKNMDTMDVRALVNDYPGNAMFKVTKRIEITDKKCTATSGCLCGTEDKEFVICSWAGASCPPAQCGSPLKPRGHCCWDFCGAVIHMEPQNGQIISHGPVERVVKKQAQGHTQHYIRKISEVDHEVILVPTQDGNLTATILAARQLLSMFQAGMPSTSIWMEESSMYPPATEAQKAGTAIGWLTLVVLLVGLSYLLATAWSKKTGRPLPAMGAIPSITGRLPSLPAGLTSRLPNLPTVQANREDLAAIRRRTQAPFEGFARFDNTTEGVDIEGFDEGSTDVDMGSNVMALSAGDLEEKTLEGKRNYSFDNPMFNIPPPANIYSPSPSQDITFGIDNPNYVAMSEIAGQEKTQKETTEANLYEVVGASTKTDPLGVDHDKLQANETIPRNKSVTALDTPAETMAPPPLLIVTDHEQVENVKAEVEPQVDPFDVFLTTNTNVNTEPDNLMIHDDMDPFATK